MRAIASPSLPSKPIIAGFEVADRAMLHRRDILGPLFPHPRRHFRANPCAMLSIVLYVLAIILCGSIGGTTGWAVSRWMGLTGVPGSLLALAVAVVVAVAAWLLGVAIYDARSRR